MAPAKAKEHFFRPLGIVPGHIPGNYSNATGPRQDAGDPKRFGQMRFARAILINSISWNNLFDDTTTTKDFIERFKRC